jgi:hypothetical protein
MGIRFTEAAVAGVQLPGGRSIISQEHALRLAMEHTVGVNEHGLLPDVTETSRFGYFSNDQYFDVLPDGTRRYYFQDRLVWLITFRGAGLVRLPIGGVPPEGTDRAEWERQRLASAHHEDNVVIDAVTGEFFCRGILCDKDWVGFGQPTASRLSRE